MQRRGNRDLTNREITMLFGAAIIVGVVGGFGFFGMFMGGGGAAGGQMMASGADPDSVDLSGFSTAAGGNEPAKKEAGAGQMLCANFGICVPGLSD